MSNINEFKKMKGIMGAYAQMVESKKVVSEMCDTCGEEPCVCESYSIPEEIAKEDAASFITAASAAKKEGKKKFEFGGKTYPVTIKDPIKTEEFKTCEGCKTESKCMAESSCGSKQESADSEEEKLETEKKGKVVINPELEEAVKAILSRGE